MHERRAAGTPLPLREQPIGGLRSVQRCIGLLMHTAMSAPAWDTAVMRMRATRELFTSSGGNALGLNLAQTRLAVPPPAPSFASSGCHGHGEAGPLPGIPAGGACEAQTRAGVRAGDVCS